MLPEEHDGPENMAIDEAVLGEVGKGASPSTLRFYEWLSPWVSLGSAQASSEVATEALAARGWGIVRRGSGGTAVLHWGQLGYALILPADHPLWHGDLVASYQRLSEPLRLAFSRVGVSAEAAPPSARVAFALGAPELASRACFGALGPYELVVQGHSWLETPRFAGAPRRPSTASSSSAAARTSSPT
jgi:lipoate-protein ligase A